MLTESPRVLCALHGDIEHQSGSQTKYAFFFEALARRFRLEQVYDVSLYGTRRYLNALRVWHPNRRAWQERYYKNPWAFVQRSKQFAAHLQSIRDEVEVVLQVGVVFDASWQNPGIPNVIYTDYTAMLAEKKNDIGRTPLGPRARAEWIRLERQAMERAAHIFTRSSIVRDAICGDYGIAPEKISVVGGGVNLPALPVIKNFSVGDCPTALFIGAELYRKGGDLVLEAFARVHQKMPNTQLLFLTADAIPANLPRDGVQLIPAKWDRQAIDALYRRADVFVLPSRLETWGDVLLEAMAYGVPCIGVRGEAMSEIIVDGETGSVVPAGDIQALAEAMTRIFSSPPLRQTWGHAARERVEINFTWSHVVERMAPLIEQVGKNNTRAF